MGACYSVNLKIKFKNEKSEESGIKALQNYIAEHNGKDINFSLAAYEKEGTTPDSLSGLLKIFLAGWDMWHPEIVYDENWICYQNGFDASYGWELVMKAMFEELSPFLLDNSEIYIHPDSDYDHFVIENGKCIQKH